MFNKPGALNNISYCLESYGNKICRYTWYVIHTVHTTSNIHDLLVPFQ